MGINKESDNAAYTATTSTAPREDIEPQLPNDRAATPDDNATGQRISAFKSLGWLDRYLAVWCFLSMVLGVLLGNFVPETGPALQRGKFVGVSVAIAIGLLVMMHPILCKVRYESLHKLFAHRGVWKQIGFSVVVNWIIAPLLMLALAWAFLPDRSELRSGLIMVGLGRCIAMVSLPVIEIMC